MANAEHRRGGGVPGEVAVAPSIRERRDLDTMAAMALGDDILDLLRRDAAFREELRRQLLTEEVLGLPAAVRELVEAQRRTEERLQEMVEHLGRLEIRVDRLAERMDQLIERVDRLAERMERLAEQVGALVGWQRGEAGRRDGERYERDVVRRAPVLFNGGQGGAPEDAWVRQRLTESLQARLSEGLLLPEEDPFLADLLWWKGEQVAVVEVSLQVNGTDVARAAARAATLARAGARALPIVVGDEWATPEMSRQAERLRVEWKVGADLSPGYLALRRQSA